MKIDQGRAWISPRRILAGLPAQARIVCQKRINVEVWNKRKNAVIERNLIGSIILPIFGEKPSVSGWIGPSAVMNTKNRPENILPGDGAAIYFGLCELDASRTLCPCRGFHT